MSWNPQINTLRNRKWNLAICGNLRIRVKQDLTKQKFNCQCQLNTKQDEIFRILTPIAKGHLKISWNLRKTTATRLQMWRIKAFREKIKTAKMCSKLPQISILTGLSTWNYQGSIKKKNYGLQNWNQKWEKSQLFSHSKQQKTSRSSFPPLNTDKISNFQIFTGLKLSFFDENCKESRPKNIFILRSNTKPTVFKTTFFSTSVPFFQ